MYFLSLSTSLAAKMSIDKKLLKAIEELLDKKLEPMNTQFKNLAASIEEALTSLAYLNAEYEDMKKKVSDPGADQEISERGGRKPNSRKGGPEFDFSVRLSVIFL